MASHSTTTPPAIEMSFTVTLAMTPEQINAYAREYGIEPAAPPVTRDALSCVKETAEAALAEQYWINTFTTVTVSAPRLRASVII